MLLKNIYFWTREPSWQSLSGGGQEKFEIIEILQAGRFLVMAVKDRRECWDRAKMLRHFISFVIKIFFFIDFFSFFS